MIRRLITHGCSFTYGEELTDPALSSWPRLVADHFGLELINLAKPAYSNDLMLGDMLQTKLNPNVGTPGERMAWDYHDLVIIGWTSHIRMGFKDALGWYSTRANSRDTSGDRQAINNLLISTIDGTWLMDRWLQQVVLAQTYLNSMHVPYLFISAFDNFYKLPNKHPLFDKINKRAFIGWPTYQMVDMAYGTPLAPGGHPTELGHRCIADSIIPALIDIHGLNPKDKEA